MSRVVCLATSHPSNAAISFWLRNFPEEGDEFPQESPPGRAARLCGLLLALLAPCSACTPHRALQEGLPSLVGTLTSTGLGLKDLHQEDDDGQQVGKVSQDAEDVHGARGAPLGRREWSAFCGQGGQGSGAFSSQASTEQTLSSGSTFLLSSSTESSLLAQESSDSSPR